MPRFTPFHDRTLALCESYAWKEWADYLAISNYDRHSEREYFAIRHTAGLLDVTPLYKYEVTGPDAAAFCRVSGAVTSAPSVVDVLSIRRWWWTERHLTMAPSLASAISTTASPRQNLGCIGFIATPGGFRWRSKTVPHQIAALALQGPRAREIFKAHC